MKKLILPILLLLITACATKSSFNTQDAELDIVFKMMQGSFNNAHQAYVDSSYYNINLEMVPLWKESGERWLYVEQSLSNDKENPYRARVYKLDRVDEQTIASAVYTIKNEEDFYGASQSKSLLNKLTIDQLEPREGCTVFLKKRDLRSYDGITGKKSCEIALRGAAYATSVVVLNNLQILSWERGFDKDSNQVWGSEKGAYIFNRNSLSKSLLREAKSKP
jgi:hypothetical protein